MLRPNLIIGLLCVLCAFSVNAQEVVTLSTTVKGNQEHPSVTYIVPWQQAADKKEISMSFNTRIGDIFNHLERVEHEREVEYLTRSRSSDVIE